MSSNDERNAMKSKPFNKYGRFSLLELKAERDSEQSEKIRIEGQIDTAIADEASGKAEIDLHWLSRARHAHKMKGLNLAKIFTEMGRRRRAQTEANIMNSSLDQHTDATLFVAAAKDLLGADAYKEIWAEVKKRKIESINHEGQIK